MNSRESSDHNRFAEGDTNVERKAEKMKVAELVLLSFMRLTSDFKNSNVLYEKIAGDSNGPTDTWATIPCAHSDIIRILRLFILALENGLADDWQNKASKSQEAAIDNPTRFESFCEQYKVKPTGFRMVFNELRGNGVELNGVLSKLKSISEQELESFLAEQFPNKFFVNSGGNAYMPLDLNSGVDGSARFLAERNSAAASVGGSVVFASKHDNGNLYGVHPMSDLQFLLQNKGIFTPGQGASDMPEIFDIDRVTGEFTRDMHLRLRVLGSGRVEVPIRVPATKEQAILQWAREFSIENTPSAKKIEVIRNNFLILNDILNFLNRGGRLKADADSSVFYYEEITSTLNRWYIDERGLAQWYKRRLEACDCDRYSMQELSTNARCQEMLAILPEDFIDPVEFRRSKLYQDRKVSVAGFDVHVCFGQQSGDNIEVEFNFNIDDPSRDTFEQLEKIQEKDIPDLVEPNVLGDRRYVIKFYDRGRLIWNIKATSWEAVKKEIRKECGDKDPLTAFTLASFRKLF